jgi:uncharacterized protein (DUF2267 family)
MINLNEQLDSIIAEQLKDVHSLLNNIQEGPQKEFIKNSMNQMKKERTLDPSKFVEQFAKIKGEKVDIEKLKSIIKNSSNGS